MIKNQVLSSGEFAHLAVMKNVSTAGRAQAIAAHVLMDTTQISCLANASSVTLRTKSNVNCVKCPMSMDLLTACSAHQGITWIQFPSSASIANMRQAYPIVPSVPEASA